jgi:hypothetical protein
VFSLGIGRNVSHMLVEGLARAGRGFSQLIMDEREGMESKVARMLGGGLSAHVTDHRLEWEGKPSDAVDHNTAPASINLFDTTADTDPPVSFLRPSDNFVPPSVLQAPYKLPSLFPFSRTTAYVLLSDHAPRPLGYDYAGKSQAVPNLS